MKSLAKNSLYNAIYQVFNLLFPLIASIYVARTLMPDGVGRVAYAQNIASYFVTAAALGVPTVGLRVISVVRNQREELNKAFSELLLFNAISTTLSLGIYIVLIFVNPVFNAELELYLASGLVVAFNYLNIDWMYQGYEEYEYIVIRNIVTKVLSLLALFVLVKKKDDYVIYAVITSLATCGNYIFNVLHARRFVSLRLCGLNIRQHVRPILVLAATLFLGSIYSKVDTTMLGIISGEESVGYYSYAHKVLQIGISVCTAVTSTLLPRFSYYFEHDRNAFHDLISKGMQIVSFLAFPAAFGLFLLAPEAIGVLFGAEFLPAAKTLQLFSVLILVFGFGNLLCYQMMISSGNEKMLVPIYTIAAVLNIALNAFLIPVLHENGAAIASVCTELFINCAVGFYIGRKLQIKYNLLAVKQAILSAVIMAVCIVPIKALLVNDTAKLFLGVGVGIVIYFAMNLVIKNHITIEIIHQFKKHTGLFISKFKKKEQQ